MPFYEYQCRACGAQVEVMQKISDAPLKKCPECGKSQLTRLISAPVFRLKGAGWYETDFKSDKDKKRNLASGEKDTAPAESSAAPAATKEAKPAAASDAKPAAKPVETASRSATKTKATKPVKRAAAGRAHK